MNTSVLIGMPSYGGLIPAMTVQSLLQLHKPVPCAFMIVERQRIDKSRNSIVLEALRNGMSHVLMVDDDNPVPPDTLEIFLQDDKDIVIAPIPGRVPNRLGQHPLCAFYQRTVEVDGAPLRLYEPVVNFREGGPLHRVDAGGTGCMLVKRQVLEVLFAKYQEYIFEFGDIRFQKKVRVDGIEYERRTMSEDCEFCERAVDAGFEIWLDDRIRPYHMTSMGLVQWRDQPLLDVSDLARNGFQRETVSG